MTRQTPRYELSRQSKIYSQGENEKPSWTLFTFRLSGAIEPLVYLSYMLVIKPIFNIIISINIVYSNTYSKRKINGVS